jgi:hypothetical protein
MRQQVPLSLVVLFVLILATMLPANGLAAPPNARRYAVTDPNAVDADFLYQGEYAGQVVDSRCRYVATGLQVIARGDGEFEAVHYRGGLPGGGWDGQTTESFSGQLREGVLVLNSDAGRTIMADGHVATVFDSSGNRRGDLNKSLRISPTLGAAAPPGATVLFDGRSTEHLQDAKITDDGLLDVGVTTKILVQDFRLHLEFRLPYMPYATGQGRANSGVYIQRRYEVQILDSFGLEGVANECGALYRQQPPDVNMCLPPLTWQTYDIWFTAARFDEEGNKIRNARITVLHNGFPIHSDYEVVAKTGAGRPEGPEPMPILLQNHGNPVRFQNIWIVLGEGQRGVKCVVTRSCPRRRCFPRIRRLLCRIRCRR